MQCSNQYCGFVWREGLYVRARVRCWLMLLPSRRVAS